MELRTFTPVEELLSYYSSVCEITSAPLLVSHCGYFFLSLDAGYFLAGSSLFLINSCLAVSCDFGVLVRRGELTKFFLLCHLV